MTLWHPLKLAGILYIIADLSLLGGSVVAIDPWLAASGICGLLGNASLLLGGSGAKRIDGPRMRRIAPYAERLSLGFYVLQYLTFGASYLYMYQQVVVSGLVGTIVGLIGTLAGGFIKQDFIGLRPYQVAGGLWLLAALIGLYAAVAVMNWGVIVGTVALIFGAICVMLSHRAEFADTNR